MKNTRRLDRTAGLLNQRARNSLAFTNHQLARASALSNVELPLRYAGVNHDRKERARAVLQAVGLGDRVNHRPNELSGVEIIELLLNLNKERGTTLVIVTHDPSVTAQTQRVINIRDGVVVENG